MLPTASAQSVLLLLMEEKGMKQGDLVEIFGSQEVVSEVIKGKRSISENEAKALGEFFNVSPGLFML
ncbi:MAG: helix-turn-helix domain-containing protein [Gomphosphaeria aponina SAG 52.96 = DSM 107014]|uniref:Helix-turn-helix domain-containing protein n=1 Tax=Gomphosphaeria aponina SAG 52.96 = DSM 107014 TaxID=1521640 RepID=A0A941GMD1_9CHRO|nr:helix-turn-helix domain-containing protein [Gomphosphaeria aponina SAG 52.96 = DSM 107014]